MGWPKKVRADPGPRSAATSSPVLMVQPGTGRAASALDPPRDRGRGAQQRLRRAQPVDERGPAADVELGVDVAQAVLDGLGAEEQCGGGVTDGATVDEQQRDLQLARVSWLEALAPARRAVVPVATSSSALRSPQGGAPSRLNSCRARCSGGLASTRRRIRRSRAP